MKLFRETCFECSRLITQRYSTSFSMGIRAFDPKFRAPIYGIYGFVRFADEIVDTFHGFPKKELLDRFTADTYRAIEERISLNPVLHSFQNVVHEYGIEHELIAAFLHSMEMDLEQNEHSKQTYDDYIFGSAEVVGLMCLRVFTEKNEEKFQVLKDPARRLGAAFQKINFLRDLKADHDELGRVYFPGVDFKNFDARQKAEIEADIKADFDTGLEGIRNLPNGARFGVYLAYVYYQNLFLKIRNSPATLVAKKRIRVSDKRKVYLLFSSAVKNQLGWI